MIDLIKAKKYCCDKLYLIENYDQAINDESQTWDCHHRLETELNLSVKELNEKDMYYNRPASELIFLTHSKHQTLHKKGEKNPMYGKCHKEETRKKQSNIKKGEKNPMYGKNAEDYMSPEAIKEKRRKQSESIKGEKHPMYGKPSPIRGRHRVYREDGRFHYE